MKIFLSYFLVFITSLFLFTSCSKKKRAKDGDEQMQKESFNFDTTAIQIFPFNCSIRAIAPIDENTLWFAGSKGHYGHTKDGGKTWNVDSLKYAGQPKLEFRSIAVTNDNIFLLSIASPALLFKSSDQGANWKVVYQENDTLAFYDAMAFWNDELGIAMGDPTDGCLSVIKTVDGGESWKKIPCEKMPPTVDGEAAFAASNGNIALIGTQAWIVSGGKKSRVFHSRDYGESWSVYPTPIVQGEQMTGIFSCDFFDEKTGIIMGGNWGEQSLNVSNKAATFDSGKSWQLIADGQEPGYRSSVQYIGKYSADHIMATGTPGTNYSSDGGKNWELISNEGFYTLRRAGNVIWLAGNKKIARWPVK